jgi:hypothetical protein
MARVIEFYVRDLFPKKVRPLPRDRSGKVIEFPKDKTAVTGEWPTTDKHSASLVTVATVISAAKQ